MKDQEKINDAWPSALEALSLPDGSPDTDEETDEFISARLADLDEDASVAEATEAILAGYWDWIASPAYAARRLAEDLPAAGATREETEAVLDAWHLTGTAPWRPALAVELLVDHRDIAGGARG